MKNQYEYNYKTKSQVYTLQKLPIQIQMQNQYEYNYKRKSQVFTLQKMPIYKHNYISIIFTDSASSPKTDGSWMNLGNFARNFPISWSVKGFTLR